MIFPEIVWEHVDVSRFYSCDFTFPWQPCFNKLLYLIRRFTVIASCCLMTYHDIWHFTLYALSHHAICVMQYLLCGWHDYLNLWMMLRHVIFMSCQIMWFNVMSYHVMSCNFLFHVKSCYLMSCHIISCHVMSFNVMPYHVTSCHFYAMWCHIMSRHVIQFHVISCHFVSFLCYVISCSIKQDCSYEIHTAYFGSQSTVRLVLNLV